MASQVSNELSFHETYDKWSLYAHLPHDTDWSLDSYKMIMTIETLEQLVSLLNYIPDNIIKTCMLFYMRHNIKPVWEDKHNVQGGSFSYKVQNKDVVQIWKKLSYMITCENSSSNMDVLEKINGITISPKKQFCIIKIWMQDCSKKNGQIFDKLVFLEQKETIFKKHI